MHTARKLYSHFQSSFVVYGSGSRPHWNSESGHSKQAAHWPAQAVLLEASGHTAAMFALGFVSSFVLYVAAGFNLRRNRVRPVASQGRGCLPYRGPAGEAAEIFAALHHRVP